MVTKIEYLMTHIEDRLQDIANDMYDLKQENARLARENELLRAVAAADATYIKYLCSPDKNLNSMLGSMLYNAYLNRRIEAKAAIDGGALEADPPTKEDMLSSIGWVPGAASKYYPNPTLSCPCGWVGAPIELIQAGLNITLCPDCENELPETGATE